MGAIINTDAFNRVISSVKRFVSENPIRGVHNWIRLEFGVPEQSLTAVACDGYRMAVEHAACLNCDRDFVVYVHDDIKLPRRNKAVFELDGGSGKLIITCGDSIYGYKQPQGEFLDWRGAIPTSKPQYRIGFNGNLLLQALQSAKTSVGGSFKTPVVMELRSNLEPIIFRTNEQDVKMVMPIRIRQEECDDRVE